MGTTATVMAITRHPSPKASSQAAWVPTQQPRSISAAEAYLVPAPPKLATPTTNLIKQLVARNGWPLTKAELASEMEAVEPPVRMAASLPPPPSTTTTTTAPAYNPATEGMGYPGSFQACVAWNESTDGTLSSDVYGILPYIWNDVIGFSGSPYDASLVTQDSAFWILYDKDGVWPWRPYDGC
jgi:hypothetical protein